MSDGSLGAVKPVTSHYTMIFMAVYVWSSPFAVVYVTLITYVLVEI